MAERKSSKNIAKKNSKENPKEKPQAPQEPQILPVPITKEMQKAYLDYAMSVIIDRALPEVGDGLKPSQRRILVAMNDLGLGSTGKYRKSAKIAGDTSGNYHPHGESVVYPTMVRMAQDFNLRYPLVDGQGNFGSIDGDPPAAMRYTEARMTKFGELMLKDLEKETVDYRLTYDGSRQEPTILPALFPNLICNGVTGIAVAMATNIPPHNLGEVVDALTFMIDEIKIVEEKLDAGNLKLEKKLEARSSRSSIEPQASSPASSLQPPASFQIDSDATVEDLTKFIKGPDFPTAGEIYDNSEIIQAYATGKGRIVMRAKATIEEGPKSSQQIVVTEIPYQVNKAVLVTRIAQLVKDGKLGKIRGLRDESSDRDGMRIIIELKKDARPQQVLNLLYKHTNLQKSFNVNTVALVDGEPRVLTLKMLLEEFLRHRKQIIVNRTLYLLKKARARAHILEGLKIALDHIDAVIETIKKSKTQEVAKVNLIKKFELTEIQATAILDMQLRRLAALERQKIEDELKEVLKAIADYEALLASPKKIMNMMKKGFLELKGKYGDKRRTKVFKQKAGEFGEEELIESQDVIVTITKSGYIKRLPRDTYKSQGRGGKGVRGAQLKEEDIVEEMLTANTHDTVLFFTNKGKVYSLRVWDIPDASRTAKGVAIVNLINLEAGEKIKSILTLSKENGAKFLIAVTRKGTVKRTLIEQFENIRKTGIIAIKLAEDDELCWVRPTDGKSEILLVSANGKSIRFDENDSRAMGRSAAGVRGIKLLKDDHVVGMGIIGNLKSQISNLKSLLVVTENGYGKLTKIEEYPTQKRGGSGVLTARINKKTGPVVSGRLITGREGDLVIISTGGQVIRLPIKDISVLGRATQGVRLMKLSKDDKVAALAALE